MTKGVLILSDDPNYAAALALVTGSAPPASGMSPDGSILMQSDTGSLKNAAGTWSFHGQDILLNGTHFAGGEGTEIGIFNGGQLYAIGGGGVVYLAGAGSWSVSPTNPFTAAPPVVVPPATNPLPPVLTPGGAYPGSALATAINATAPAGTCTLPAETISATVKLPFQINLIGAGIGQTIIDMTGVAPVEGKSCIALGSSGCTIKGLTLRNTGAPDANSVGGIRDDLGQGGVVDTVEITGFDMGLGPTSAGNDPWVLQGAHNIHGNGNPGAGDTHEVYIGTCPSLTVSGGNVGPSRDAHCIKSRALVTTISNETLPTGGMGSCLDQPDGGAVSVTGGTWTINPAPAAFGPNYQDTVFFHYGEESGNNGAGGAVFNGVHFVIAAGLGGGVFINGGYLPNATITFNGCTWSGDAAPTFQGYAAANIIGTIAKA
jgi:hypothetical protein